MSVADPAAQSGQFVREVLNRRLAPLRGLGAKMAHNPFLDAIDPRLATYSSLTRSLTSKLGGILQAIARDLAIARFGVSLVPAILFSDTVAMSVAGQPVREDTVIYTQVNQQYARAEATRLLRSARRGPPDTRIGTPAFRDSFRQAVAQLLNQPRESTPWSHRVDLFVAVPTIGLAELESGGNLDSSNVKGQPEKLVLAGLALADPEVPIHFSLAYNNRGEGNRISGSLPGYFALAGSTEPSSGLLVGSAWWERLLPPGVSFSDFVRQFGSVAVNLGVLQPE